MRTLEYRLGDLSDGLIKDVSCGDRALCTQANESGFSCFKTTSEATKEKLPAFFVFFFVLLFSATVVKTLDLRSALSSVSSVEIL